MPNRFNCAQTMRWLKPRNDKCVCCPCTRKHHKHPARGQHNVKQVMTILTWVGHLFQNAPHSGGQVKNNLLWSPCSFWKPMKTLYLQDGRK